MLFIESKNGHYGKEETLVLNHLTEDLKRHDFLLVDKNDFWLKQRDSIYLGTIGFIELALQDLGLKLPEFETYPEILNKFYGRAIDIRTVADLMMNEPETQLFIKPLNQKEFTGTVIEGAIPFPFPHLKLDTSLYVSEVVTFIEECRVYIIGKMVVWTSNYSGGNTLPPEDWINTLVDTMQKTTSYSIDVGLLSTGEWVIVECNPGYALGIYDCPVNLYYKFIENFWVDFWNACKLTKSLTPIIDG